MQKFSLSIAKIEMLFKEGDKVSIGGQGTAFFYKTDNADYLVTNWHNVTGVNNISLKAIHSLGLLPNVIRIHYKKWVDDEKKIMQSVHTDYPLYNDEAPVWYEHKNRHKVDVVAIPIITSSLNKFANEFINLVDQEDKLDVYAGMDCFILGFPENLSGPANTPIWKRGSIAAEPYLDQPYFVDAATRKGMSGSPIVARHSGIFGLDGGKFNSDTIIGTVEKFIAVYSGRVGDDALGFQLGKAWQASVLADILTLRTKGKNPLL